MKKAIIAIAVWAASVSAFAQGVVNFNNIASFGTATEAVVFDVNGTTKLAGPAFLAQLYWSATSFTGLGGSAVASAPATFFTVADGADGFWNPAQATVGVASGTPVFLQVRSWNAAAGATYEAAALNAAGKVGASGVFSVTAGGGTLPPPDITGPGKLSSFKLNAVPEPSTIALGILGAGALLLRRRK